MKKKYVKTLVILISILSVLALSTTGYIFLKQSENQKEFTDFQKTSDISRPISDSNKEKLNSEMIQLNPPNQTVTKSPVDGIKQPTLSDKTIDILLIGVDSREMQLDSQSDLIMIARIDKINKTIKLVSIARDIYVNIPGYTDNRINEALVYGGPELLIKTLNQYFDLNLKFYFVFNFKTAEELINLVGKVSIDINKNDLQYINSYIDEINNLSPINKSPLIMHTGVQLLDGRQAVAYARYRPSQISDIERTSRERTVAYSFLQQVRKLSPTKLPEIINKSLEAFYTNIPITQYSAFAMDMYNQRNSTFDEMVIPVKGSFIQEQIVEMKYFVINVAQNRNALHNFFDGGVP